MTKELLKVNNLKKYFEVRKGVFSKVSGYVKAVDDVSFYINKGETLGLVGESGCGKSTTGRAILRIHEPTSGEVIFNGENILDYNQSQLRELRKDMQMIYQDPYESLSPRLTVEDIIGEAYDIHGLYSGKERRKRIIELMVTVGLRPEHLKRYPHEFSGGQRQRIGIARALTLNPKLIICDEPVSALDVSVQGQVINLMDDLQDEFDLTYLFISHDLRVVKHKCDRIAVMYLGQIVEMADKDELYNNTLHPYTKALLSAVPKSRPWQKRETSLLKGEVGAGTVQDVPGCRFYNRCNMAKPICKEQQPDFKDYGGKHYCACHMI